MRETPPSGHPRDAKPYDSEAPTQLWDNPSKDRNTSQFSLRRAARRRERLEALLKGYEENATSTELGTPLGSANVAPLRRDVAPPPALPQIPAAPSLPTGTYTSVRPVTGPRLAVFVALGVAMGGLAALQIDRLISPASPAVAASGVERPQLQVEIPLAQAAEPALELNEPSEETVILADENAEVPPLQVEIVPLRAPVKTQRPALAETPPATNVSPVLPPELAFAPAPQQSSCGRYPAVHVPTQLHPRINPLMTSNQVFTERSGEPRRP
jgi:hypothetical protein